MQIEAFKRIVTTFADPKTDILIQGEQAMMQINGNIIDVSLKQHSGELSVVEAGIEMPANHWVLTRLAQLPLLADRLISMVPITSPYVTPEGEILASLEITPSEQSEHVLNAVDATLKVLDNRSPLENDCILYHQ